MNEILTQGELIDKLYEEMSRQNTIYITVIVAMVTVVLGIALAYTWQQLKFSDKGIERMKNEFKDDFKIKSIRKEIIKANKASSNAKKDLKKLEDKEKEIDEKTKIREENAFGINLEMASSSIQNDMTQKGAVLCNEMTSLMNVFKSYQNVDVNSIYISNVMTVLINMFDGIDDFEMSGIAQNLFNKNLEDVQKEIKKHVETKKERRLSDKYQELTEKISSYLDDNRVTKSEVK